MKAVTWDEVVMLAHKGLVGDIFIIKPDGSMLRGPLMAVLPHDHGHITFETIWLAWRRSVFDAWVANPLPLKAANMRRTKPEVNSKGTISFTHPELGSVDILKKVAERLDPRQVPTLVGEQVRKSRAWEYDLPLNSSWREIADHVTNLGPELVSPDDMLQVQAEAVAYT